MLTFAELIKQIDLWHFDITLFVMDQFEEIEKARSDCKRIEELLAEYDQEDRQWTILHTQLIKKQRYLREAYWVAISTAFDETRFALDHDGKGTYEDSEPTWTMADASHCASLRNKWLPFIKKAREMNKETANAEDNS